MNTNKKVLLVAAMTSFSLMASAQTKLDMNLYSLAKQSNVALAKGQSDNRKVTVIGVLKKGNTAPLSALNTIGAKVNLNAYGFVTMRVPVSRLAELEAMPEFEAFESNKSATFTNKRSQEVSHVNEVQDAQKTAAEGLPQTYNGEGVTYASFDAGIDFQHVNFRDPATNKTRIKKAMIMRNFILDPETKTTLDGEGNPVEPISVLEEYDNESDIDTLTTDTRVINHGSHTISTGAGSYDGDWVNKDGEVTYTNMRGAAYKADLCVAGCAIPTVETQMGVYKKFDDYARQSGKPMVVSLSLGDNIDWLDGKLAINKYFDALTENGTRKGFIIALSAGNEGRNNWTLHKSLDESNGYTLKTKIKKEYPSESVVTLMNDTEQMLNIGIEVVNAIGEVLAQYTMEQLVENGALTYSNEEAHDNRFKAKLTLSNELYGNPEPYFDVNLIVKAADGKTCKPRMYLLSDNDYDNFHGDETGEYIAGDASSSINTFVTTNSVLSIGAWDSHQNHTAYLYPEYKFTEPCTNDIADFSSYTDADDNGIARPDCCAPGVAILSGENSYVSMHFDDNGEPLLTLGDRNDDKPMDYDEPMMKNDDEIVDDEDFGGNEGGNANAPKNYEVLARAKNEADRPDGHHSYMTVMDGTSMSCPNAASIFALWLQANPELTVNDIRKVLRATCDKDEYVEANPYRFGAGKINALAGLKYILKNIPTAIHEVENGEPKGLEEPTACKSIKNGQIVIVKNGKQYNVAGQEM